MVNIIKNKMYSYNMKDPDVIIVKQLTHAECLNKDRLVLIKYIIARMADLNPFPPKCDPPRENR